MKTFTPSQIYETANEHDLEVTDSPIDETLHILEIRERERHCDTCECITKTVWELHSTDGEKTYTVVWANTDRLTDQDLRGLFT